MINSFSTVAVGVGNEPRTIKGCRPGLPSRAAPPAAAPAVAQIFREEQKRKRVQYDDRYGPASVPPRFCNRAFLHRQTWEALHAERGCTFGSQIERPSNGQNNDKKRGMITAYCLL